MRMLVQLLTGSRVKRVSELVKQLILDQIQSLSAYHVQPAENMVKLDAMENPYELPKHLKQPWLDLLSTAAINRYPSPQPKDLIAQLRTTQAIPADAQIMLGNGSDELIQIICMAVAKPDRTVMSVIPSFVMYEQTAVITGMKFHGVSLQEDFSIDLEQMLSAIEEHQPAVIFLAYPNNPTANSFAREQLLQIIKAAPGLVVMDEAYAPFAADTMMGEVLQHDNLLLMRTLSKFGLAGCRLGYMCGPEQWMSELDKIRMPYNINILTQLTAEFALQHTDVFSAQAEEIKQQRHVLIEQLRSQTNYKVHDSQANFVLFKTAAGQADRIFSALKLRKILIKNLSAQGGLLDQTLRVTIGTPEENQLFMQALSDNPETV